MPTIGIAPELLEWAVSRGSTPLNEVRRKFPAYEAWRLGTAQPTLRQLEAFARATNTPVGFLLLDAPPEEVIPVADFRVRNREGRAWRSASLLDQLYLCEQRQAWYAEYARTIGLDRVNFVGSLGVEVDPDEAALQIRSDLGITATFGRAQRTWAEALSNLAQRVEDLGALVMISGVVGSNTHRPLDPEEFSGFSLSDQFAPLIFVNGTDTKAAQVFTLAHELAHLYIGDSALSKIEPGDLSDPAHEEWSNTVAARLLIDGATLRDEAPARRPTTAELDELAKIFKVSTLVVLRRMLETRLLSREVFLDAYRGESERVSKLPRRRAEAGGSFYSTAPVRASKRFTRSIVRSTLEGQTLYRDAFALLGTSKASAIHGLAASLGVR